MSEEKLYNLKLTKEELDALPIIKELASTYLYELYEKKQGDRYYLKHENNMKLIDDFQSKHQGVIAVACNIVDKIDNMNTNVYCKGYGLNCDSCNNKKCDDVRGKLIKNTTSISIGDVLLFNKHDPFHYDLGVVREIAIISDSTKDDRISKKEYKVDTFEEGIKLVTVTEDEIKFVYRMENRND